MTLKISQLVVTDERFQKLKNELQQEEVVSFLIQSIALAEKLHFTIMVCEDPIQAEAVLKGIEEEVVIIRGEPAHFLC